MRFFYDILKCMQMQMLFFVLLLSGRLRIADHKICGRPAPKRAKGR